MGKRIRILMIIISFFSIVGCSYLDVEEQVNIMAEDKLKVQKHTKKKQFEQIKRSPFYFPKIKL